jgi:hypothetical protein
LSADARFASSTGGAWGPDTVKMWAGRYLCPAIEATGLGGQGIVRYDARHSYVSMQIASGLNVLEAAITQIRVSPDRG